MYWGTEWNEKTYECRKRNEHKAVRGDLFGIFLDLTNVRDSFGAIRVNLGLSRPRRLTWLGFFVEAASPASSGAHLPQGDYPGP